MDFYEPLHKILKFIDMQRSIIAHINKKKIGQSIS